MALPAPIPALVSLCWLVAAGGLYSDTDEEYCTEVLQEVLQDVPEATGTSFLQTRERVSGVPSICRNVGPDDADTACYKLALWAKQIGVTAHPERFTSPYKLSENSTISDFQYHFHTIHPGSRCPEPCVDCTIRVLPVNSTHDFSMPPLPLGRCVQDGRGGAFKATSAWNNGGICTTLNWTTIYHWPHDVTCAGITHLTAQVYTDGSTINCPFSPYADNRLCTSAR
mmetsp:Transcript_113220/g.300802  ORF Transcript_113220/g.300802 Transcript_113220/m.300802 type:complete len:226 (-) Transcript_113220:173-850(-)